MKRLIYLCLVALAPLGTAQAQQTATSPAATSTPAVSSGTDNWGTEPSPATAVATEVIAGSTKNQAVTNSNQPSATPAATGGLNELLAADAKPATEPVALKIKPAPKLNPNSTGSYNKKAVAKQHKLSEKATVKRQRQTQRYQAVREYGQLTGIRRMQKGKIPTRTHHLPR